MSAILVLPCAGVAMVRPDTAEIKRPQLMDALHGKAVRLGAHLLRLDTVAYRTTTHARYRKLGCREIERYREGEEERCSVPAPSYRCIMHTEGASGLVAGRQA
ncbi:MAG: hypothetical protein AAF968_21710 [Pseudomonadota bacterium]